MGIIRAAFEAVRGGLADQWLEVFEAGDMSDTTVMTTGVKVRTDKRNRNLKGTDNIVTDGSIIHVYPNQFMILTDGGKVIDYTAEPGYYKVDNKTSPSLFNGQFGEALKETFGRIKFGGTTPYAQKVIFINLQEIKNIPFGTVNAVNYFDTFYNAELFLRCHGYFSIRIVDPLKFYAEAIPKNRDRVEITDIHKLYLSEFLTALQASINKMSADGIRISHVTSKGMELAKYMADVLDDTWTEKRGMLIESVGINSISYDENSRKLIDRYNQVGMMAKPELRETYVQTTIADSIKAAASNNAGAMTGFLGLGMAMQTGGAFMSAASQTNQFQMQQQMQQQAQQSQQAQPAGGETWVCSCGTSNSGKFCINCGKPKAADGSWKCSCGSVNTGKFCPQCGSKKPETQAKTFKCDKCGWQPADPANPPKFCPECGDPFNEQDMI
ncbi:SPFH domain-containing protein [Thermoclostridium caenicola]|uniref:Membrane protease subunit, stomatin/prohibitin family, contains C-terminal Zn-ribbon domain n=1 Tax=Thermoclostridium caenicola TaxID=659425 RepID=A0A1M6KAP5_9FIRM|nr:SPFH domain-containing protein [Thermoclostridium caenicola]SHJ55969.1 Membrane protease subunit, stomatin/prohibitin family, contains C-terminal Zn-ribbon domain [Thermoclostridium caenicola]HOP73321.1 SPFH domain-containing protein [Thermoclostridium caenicola]